MPSMFDPLTTPGRTTTQVAVMSGIIPNRGGGRELLGATKGGADLNLAERWRAAEFDGRRHIAIGTEEKIENGPSRMTATVIEFSDKVLAMLTPGGEVNGNTTTPIRAGVALTRGQYILEPWYEVTLSDGTVIRWEFDAGIVIEAPDVATRDKEEATLRIVIEARVDPTKPGYSTDDPDYRRIVVPAGV